MNVSVAELKAGLSAILKKAAEGEEVVVTRHGKPLVKISEAQPDPEDLVARRRAFMGSLKGKGFWMADDFDEPLEDFKDYM